MKLAQAIVQGLEVGGFYAVLASGLTLIFGIMNVVNVAYGALLVLAGLFTFELWRRAGIDPLLTIVLTTPVMFAVGWVLYRTLVRRVRGAPASMSVLLTFALAITIEGIMGMVWKNVFRSVTPSYFTQAFHLGRLTLGKVDLYGLAVALAVLAALYLLLSRTWMGRAIRSTMENPRGAQLVGIPRGGRVGVRVRGRRGDRRRGRRHPGPAPADLPSLALHLDLARAGDHRAWWHGQPPGRPRRRADPRYRGDDDLDLPVGALGPGDVLPGHHGRPAGPPPRPPRRAPPRRRRPVVSVGRGSIEESPTAAAAW